MRPIEAVEFIIPEKYNHPKDNFFSFYKAVNEYSEFDKKIYIGSDFVCRYCGETGRNFFKKDNSHTFPECTGNKWLYSKDECTKCNQHFSIYENELGNHGHIMRTFLGLKTKKGAPTKYKSEAFKIQRKESGFEMDLFSGGGKTIDPEKHGSLIFNIDFVKKEEKATIKIPQIKFIPFYLFKCLIKIGLAIMPDSEFINGEFDELKSWLLTNENLPNGEKTPLFYVYYASLKFADRKPLLQLYKKTEEYNDLPIPTYSLYFSYGNDMFQVFIPNCKSDKWIYEQSTDISKVKIPIIPFFVGKSEEKRAFHLIDGNVFEKVTDKGYKTFTF